MRKQGFSLQPHLEQLVTDIDELVADTFPLQMTMVIVSDKGVRHDAVRHRFTPLRFIRPPAHCSRTPATWQRSITYDGDRRPDIRGITKISRPVTYLNHGRDSTAFDASILVARPT